MFIPLYLKTALKTATYYWIFLCVHGEVQFFKWKETILQTNKMKNILVRIMGWIVFPPNLYVEAPQNVITFGDRVFKEVIKFRCGHMGGPYSNTCGVLIRNGIWTCRGMRECAHSKGHVRTQWDVARVALWKPKRETSEETKPATTFEIGCLYCTLVQIRKQRLKAVWICQGSYNS